MQPSGRAYPQRLSWQRGYPILWLHRYKAGYPVRFEPFSADNMNHNNAKVCMKIKLTITIMLAALALLPSCSIKEDRSVCPCYVSVVTEAGSDCLVSFFDASGSLLERKVIPAGQLRSGDNYTQVPRGPFHVSVLENMGSMLLDGGRRLECMEGRQAAPLYAFSVSAVAEGDAMTVEGTLQKQHAVVTVQLRNADGDT